MAGLTVAQMLMQWVAIMVLISLSALFAGLTLGLMSLDITGLEIVIASGSAKESAYAKKIYPIRSRGNLLLCTLLLGNVSVNAMMSILMADLTSGVVGFLLSTVLIVVLGEIVPQAACSRHALAVGARTVWVVYIFLFIFFPFAYPISAALDYFLGAEMATIYTRNELKKLLDIHSIHMEESGVSSKDVRILSGVLDYSSKKVVDIMTPIDTVFMLDIESKLDLSTLTLILEKGHSRVPIYEKERNNIVSLMLVKDLAIVNPEECLALRSFLGFYGRELLKLKSDMTLDNVLTEFKTGKSHMALVVRSDDVGPAGQPLPVDTSNVVTQTVPIGVVTLEDVIEEILQDEIMDEMDVNRQKKTEDSGYKQYASFRELASAKLTRQQIVAVTAFLSGSLPEFSKKVINDEAFTYLLRNSTILELDKPLKGEKAIYTRGLPDQFFTLVLQGKLEIRSGSEGFYSDCGPFSYLGLNALKSESFVPDFTAKVMSHVQLLRIKKKIYDTAVLMTAQAEQAKAQSNSGGKKPRPQVVENKNFTDSIDFVERTYPITPNSAKPGKPIALKRFNKPNKATDKKEETQSLIRADDFAIDEDLDDSYSQETNSFTAEEARWKKLMISHSNDGSIFTSNNTGNSTSNNIANSTSNNIANSTSNNIGNSIINGADTNLS